MCILAVLLLQTASSHAASNSVHFGVNITTNNYCAIVLQQSGTIAADPTNHILSSKQVGGSPGSARVYSLTDYELTVDALGYFLTSPQHGDDGTAFSARFSGSSVYQGRNFAERAGSNAVTLPRNRYSITDVTVHLNVDRPATPFPAGNYTALTIVRCE